MGQNGLNDELRAMQNIAVALHQLDQPTRVRVLRWILERFQADVPSPSGSPSALSPAAALTISSVPEPTVGARRHDADETLSVESLTDLFVAPGPPAIGKAQAPQSITGMLQDLVAEFQDLAREWNGPGTPAVAAPDTNSVSPVVS